MSKKGFTLAEVMITISIIGVLAAMLIPTVVKTLPDNNRVMFKKAYSLLEQGVSDLISNEQYYPSTLTGSGVSTGTGSSAVIVPIGFYNTAKDATIPTTVDKFCYLLSEEFNTTTVNCGSTAGTFITADGMYWQIFDITTNTPASAFGIDDKNFIARVVVDVNGNVDSKNNPIGGNCGDTTNPGLATNDIPLHATTACTNGKTPDRYEIGVRYDGKLEVISNTGIDILGNPSKNIK